jgi:hypothetical protein
MTASVMTASNQSDTRECQPSSTGATCATGGSAARRIGKRRCAACTRASRRRCRTCTASRTTAGRSASRSRGASGCATAWPTGVRDTNTTTSSLTFLSFLPPLHKHNHRGPPRPTSHLPRPLPLPRPHPCPIRCSLLSSPLPSSPLLSPPLLSAPRPGRDEHEREPLWKPPHLKDQHGGGGCTN